MYAIAVKNPRAVLLAPVICAIPLLGWWMYGLFDLDEGFYAAVVAEMNRRGEWITPFYNGKPWFEKPVLLYWLAKPSLALFGGEFGIRLPSILASLATFALLLWFGKRRLGPHSGLVAALVLSTSLFFAAVGRMVLVDPILITCLTGAFVTLWESLIGDRRWRLATAALLGLAVLAKGPVSCVLFAAVVFYTIWRERELRAAFGGVGVWLFGTLVFLGVVAAWYVPAYLANHQVFVDEFLIKQNLQRFRGGDEAHAVPMPAGLVYYIPVVLIGMIPWSLFVPRAWPRRGDDAADAPVRRYLATWAVVVLAFFTVSGTKLPHYVLPCFPPLALLVGHDLATRWKGFPATRAAAIALGAACLASLLTFGFSAWYEAANAEPKRIATATLASPGRTESVAMYRLGGQPAGKYPSVPKPMLLGRIPVGLNETSLPSLLFYLDPLLTKVRQAGGEVAVAETDSFDELLHLKGPTLVITRPGRFPDDEQRVLKSAARLLSQERTERHLEIAELPEASSARVVAYRIDPIDFHFERAAPNN